MRKQQKLEHHYFELFRKAYGLPPVTYRDKPDVVTTAGTQTLGIEITNFYISDGSCPTSEQVQRKRREDALMLARSLYTKSSTAENIQLSVGFDNQHPIDDFYRVAAQLAGVARHIDTSLNGAIRRDLFGHIPEIESIHVYAHELQYSDEPDPEFPDGQPEESEGFEPFSRYRNRREARALQAGIYKPLSFAADWKVVQVQSPGLICPDRLQEIVRQKDLQAQSYARCDAYWLLVVVDFIDPAQDQEIRTIGDITLESAAFERVLLYKTAFDHIVEIKTTKATSTGVALHR